MSEGVRNLINAIAGGDTLAINDAFNTEMASRISSRLDDMRVEVARNMFKTPVVEEQVENIEEEVLDFEELSEEDVAVALQSLTDEEINEQLSEEEDAALTEKYMGFSKLKGSLARKPGVKNPAALAAAIGRKKYGKEKFQRMAAAGKD